MLKAVLVSLVIGCSQANAEDVVNAPIDKNSANFVEIIEGNEKPRFYDVLAGAAWSEAATTIQEKCRERNNVSCWKEVWKDYRSKGLFRGIGYCEANWADKSRDELEAIFQLVMKAYKSARNRPIIGRLDKTKGEIFYNDFDAERRCLFGLLNDK